MPREMARKGLVYRQVLSLILSERRPTYYLLQNRDALAVLTDKYLRILCEAGIIDAALRDAALDAELTFRTEPPPISTVSWVKQKATQDVRYKLVSLLKLPDLYSLDRLDLTAESSVDTAAQARITVGDAAAWRPGLPAPVRADRPPAARRRQPGEADLELRAVRARHRPQPRAHPCRQREHGRSTSIPAPNCSSARPPNCAR